MQNSQPEHDLFHRARWHRTSEHGVELIEPQPARLLNLWQVVGKNSRRAIALNFGCQRFIVGKTQLNAMPRRSDFVRAMHEAVELVAKPLETIVKGVDGVEHVYTQAEDNGVMVTARFLVGSDPEDASVRINKQIDANRDKIPAGVGNPQISVKGINDVPIVVLTLSPKAGTPGQWGPEQLMQIAGKLRTEMAKVDDVGTSFC